MSEDSFYISDAGLGYTPEQRTQRCVCVTASGTLPPAIRTDAPLDVHAGSLACQWSVRRALVTASPKIVVRRAAPSRRRRGGCACFSRGEARRDVLTCGACVASRTM